MFWNFLCVLSLLFIICKGIASCHFANIVVVEKYCLMRMMMIVFDYR